jgi:hypothetical protein
MGEYVLDQVDWSLAAEVVGVGLGLTLLLLGFLSLCAWLVGGIVLRISHTNAEEESSRRR